MLPIENSLHGPVGETHDLLYEAPLSIVSEVTLPIVHCVARQGADPARGRTDVLRSYPVAFDQCRDLIHSLGSVPPVGDDGRRGARGLRVGGPDRGGDRERRGGRPYGLHVIAEDVGDKPAAFTRFVALGPYTRLDGAAALPDRDRIRHRPSSGSARRALGPFARHGLNLVQLVSRPIPHSTFRYRFDLVLDGHPLDPRGADGARRDA